MEEIKKANLANYRANKTATLPIKDPRKEGAVIPGASVIIYGPSSQEMKAASIAIRERIKALKNKPDTTDQDYADSNMQFLAEITVSFNGVELDGLEGRDLVNAIYNDPDLGYIANQVNENSTDWGKFLPSNAES